MSSNSITSTNKALIKRHDMTPKVQRVPVTLDNGTEPRVLLQGVDTIYFSFMTEISDEIWARLEMEKEAAQHSTSQRPQAQYAPEWLGAVMGTTGAKGGYHFRIEHESFTIKLLKGLPNRPAIYVEMRSFALHTHPGGTIGACEQACQYIRDVLMPDQLDMGRRRITLNEALCSRLDLHCDWQGGWTPTYTTGEDRLFVKPARVKWKPEMEGNTCTGYRFGTGKVQARIYNKTLQTTITHCEWYRELLIAHHGTNYDPTLPVWRLEFQLIREGIKGFRLYVKPEVTDPDEIIRAELEKEDLPHIGSVCKALHWAGLLWEYLTRRWLRLVESNDDPNRARWPIHPTWTVLQGGFAPALRSASLPQEKAQVVRKARHSGYERFLHRIEVGVLAMMDAEDTSPAATAHAWMAHLSHILEVAKQWEDGILRGSPDQIEAILKGMGVAGSGEYRRATLKGLFDEILGLFTSSGVAKLGMREIADMEDLLISILDDLKLIAKEKGGLGQLIIEKRAKIYKLSAKRFFVHSLAV